MSGSYIRDTGHLRPKKEESLVLLLLLSCRSAKAFPHRALSVEDVGAPSLARTVGRVVEVFPDGTSQLQLQRPAEGTFGFCVAYGNGRRDSGMPLGSQVQYLRCG